MKIVITNATVDRGAAAACALRQAGFNVHGLDALRIPRVMASRFLDSYDCIDDAAPQAWQDAVLRFIERSRADAVLPLDTPTTVLAIQRRRELESLCRINLPSSEGFLAAYDKRRTMASCAELGIPCAGSLSRGEAAHLLEEHPGRVVVVKPARDIGAAVGVQFVSDVASLDQAIHTSSSRHGGSILQEYIPGPAETMRMVTVVYGGRGRLAAAFTAQKLRQWPPRGGVTAYGVSTRDHELLSLVRPFFDRYDWRGPAEVELKRDERDGTDKVIEINPRFPGYLRHASLCGADLAVVAARAALGEDLPEAGGLSEYRAGVAYIAPAVFMKSVAREARSCGWGSAIASAWRHAGAAGPMARSLLSDPLPQVARTFVKMRPSPVMPFPEE